MSEELIRRSDAIKALKREKSDWNNDYNVPIDHCIERLNKVKSADRPQGEWIDMWDKYCFEGTFKCSVCGTPWTLIDGTPQDNGMNFCPNCGARMKGADDE